MWRRVHVFNCNANYFTIKLQVVNLFTEFRKWKNVSTTIPYTCYTSDKIWIWFDQFYNAFSCVKAAQWEYKATHVAKFGVLYHVYSCHIAWSRGQGSTTWVYLSYIENANKLILNWIKTVIVFNLKNVTVVHLK